MDGLEEVGGGGLAGCGSGSGSGLCSGLGAPLLYENAERFACSRASADGTGGNFLAAPTRLSADDFLVGSGGGGMKLLVFSGLLTERCDDTLCCDARLVYFGRSGMSDLDVDCVFLTGKAGRSTSPHAGALTLDSDSLDLVLTSARNVFVPFVLTDVVEVTDARRLDSSELFRFGSGGGCLRFGRGGGPLG